MSKGRVLIVDDETAIAETLSEMFGSWGYETATAPDGRAGLALVDEFRPSVVVTDVYMPNLDGFGLLREMRELHPATSPMTFMTSAVPSSLRRLSTMASSASSRFA